MQIPLLRDKEVKCEIDRDLVGNVIIKFEVIPGVTFSAKVTREDAARIGRKLMQVGRPD